jgi:hypothetical protein
MEVYVVISYHEHNGLDLPVKIFANEATAEAYSDALNKEVREVQKTSMPEYYVLKYEVEQ